MRLKTKGSIKVEDLEPGMMILRRGRTHWTVRVNLGQREMQVGEKDWKGVFVIYERPGHCEILWKHRAGEEVKLIEEYEDPGDDDRSPWI